MCKRNRREDKRDAGGHEVLLVLEVRLHVLLESRERCSTGCVWCTGGSTGLGLGFGIRCLCADVHAERGREHHALGRRGVQGAPDVLLERVRAHHFEILC